MLGDFQEQAGRPYEHEARLKELLSRQAELNAALDPDKGERQIAPAAGGEEGMAEMESESEGPPEAGPDADGSRPSGQVRRRRGIDCGAPGNKAADGDLESPGPKGFQSGGREEDVMFSAFAAVAG